MVASDVKSTTVLISVFIFFRAVEAVFSFVVRASASASVNVIDFAIFADIAVTSASADKSIVSFKASFSFAAVAKLSKAVAFACASVRPLPLVTSVKLLMTFSNW